MKSTLILIILAAFLVGCSEVSTDDYKLVIAEELGDFYAISNLKVGTQEISGGKLFAKVSAKSTLLADTYTDAGSLLDVNLLRPYGRQNKDYNFVATISGSKGDGEWDLSLVGLVYDTEQTELLGKPLHMFEDKDYLIIGTDDYNALVKQSEGILRDKLSGVFKSVQPFSCNGVYVKATDYGGVFNYELSIPKEGDVFESKIIARKGKFGIARSKLRITSGKHMTLTEQEANKISTHSRWKTGGTWSLEFISNDLIKLTSRNLCAEAILKRYIDPMTDPAYVKRKSDLRGRLTGVFESVRPVTYNGQVVKGNMLNDDPVYYQLTVPSEGDIFRSKITIGKDVKAFVDSYFNFTDGNSFQINEMSKKRVARSMNWFTGAQWTADLIDDNTINMIIVDGVNKTEIVLNRIK